jgi:tRNA A-37 threonylcarbamoyl transferase component Bud32
MRPNRSGRILRWVATLLVLMPPLCALADEEEPTGSAAWQTLASQPSWAAARDRVHEGFAEISVALWEALPAEKRRGLSDLRTAEFSPEGRIALIHGLAVVLVVLLALRLVRGQGDLTVSIEYPPELRGTFTVAIRRRALGEPATPRVTNLVAAKRERLAAGMARSRRHPMVAHETRFTRLPARPLFVIVDGFLQTTGGGDAVVTPHFEEQAVTLRRGRSVRVEFDFHPRECPVDVRVLWDHRPVSEATVALRGRRDSLRYVRGAPVRLGASRGVHALVIGSADRVVEHPLEIVSFDPTSVVVDLTNRDEIVFTGCPPAVEPYVLGDIPAAARALTADGQDEAAHLLLARFHQDGNRDETAATHYEQAGHHLEAARLRADLSDFEKSALLFERAGDFDNAAAMYRSAGDPLRAGEMFQRAEAYQSAAECFKQADDLPRQVEALERGGDPFEAARAAIERDEWGRAIRSLQLVSAQDDSYLEAAEMLIDAYQREGHLDLAAAKIKEVVDNRGDQHAPLEATDRLARQLEESDDVDTALEMLEIIRGRDATYPNVASRIEDLRKRRSVERGAVTPSVGRGDFGVESRYEILEEVGRGGMGIVFKARDRRLGRVVALKKLPDNLRNHPKAVELFLREARAAAALNHTNIVTLFDAGQEGETYYITMELLEGAPLQKILRTRGKLGARDAARLCVQVANGLHYAHEQKIIHRDIKTGNLFFTHSKVVKIMDFGLAKMVEEVRRAATVIGGTPYYMAPEQSVGGQVDHRADIYALGITLFELVTGRVPFDDGDVAYHHRHTRPMDPREVVSDLPEALADLIAHMLAKSPDDRCGSAARVAERLTEISKALS